MRAARTGLEPPDEGTQLNEVGQHVGAFAVGGAVLGLLAGFVADRRRI